MEITSDRNWFSKSKLFDFFLFNSNIPVIRYPVDATWDHKKLLPWNLNSAGFNPFEEKVFIPQISPLESFLSGKKPGRECGPEFMFDLITVVHDMMHIISYRWIAEYLHENNLISEIKKSEDVIDKMLYIHLVTETAAVVGLDYWHLCKLDVNDIFDVGSSFQGGFGTKYSNRVEKEIKNFRPEFTVEREDFFHEMLQFYCDGSLHGISSSFLSKSSITKEWVAHELVYGELQRKYVRDWFSFLSGKVCPWSAKVVLPRNKWQDDLATFVGNRLWRLIHKGELDLINSGRGVADLKSILFMKEFSEIDSRFNHVDLFSDDFNGPNRIYHIHNTMRRYEYGSFLPSILSTIGKVDLNTFDKVSLLLKFGKKIEPIDEIPRHLMFVA